MSRQRNDFTAWILAIVLLLVVAGFISVFLVGVSQTRVITTTGPVPTATPNAAEIEALEKLCKDAALKAEQRLLSNYPLGYLFIIPDSSGHLCFLPTDFKETVRVRPELSQVPLQVQGEFAILSLNQVKVSVGNLGNESAPFGEIRIAPLAIPSDGRPQSAGLRQFAHDGTDYELSVEAIEADKQVADRPIFVFGFRKVPQEEQAKDALSERP
jgi:hypothetical protein